MAVHGLIALLDDIATIADDVAKMTSLATRKAAGIVTDDMAVTAERMVGIRRERELPIVKAVAIGSLRNKLLILVPVALLLNQFAPWAITPLLMLGGLFLCFEGAEKIVHPDHGHSSEKPAETVEDFETLEKERVQGAIKTDFILSAEIIALSLATVQSSSFTVLVLTLIGISLVMTIGVYGLVAVLVRMDDMGLALTRKPSATAQKIGRAILWIDPRLIRAIAAIGTAAMLMVGGGIFAHGIPAIEHGITAAAALLAPVPAIGPALAWLAGVFLTLLLGFVLGVLVMGGVALVNRLRKP